MVKKIKNNMVILSKLNVLPDDNSLIKFNDRFILKIVEKLRNDGFHYYILPQHLNLPFGYICEDILVENPF